MTKAPDPLCPLLRNELTGEPYLPLPPPHSNIIITPPRADEAEIAARVALLNDLRITRYLNVPFRPYEEHHDRPFLQAGVEVTKSIVKEMEENPEKVVKSSPIWAIRELLEGGEDIYIGQARLRPWIFDNIGNPQLRKTLTEENTKKLTGDPTKVWSFGGYIAPSHKGKGIISSAIHTLIHDWAVPKMGVRKIIVAVHMDNLASIRVFEKNGFVFKAMYMDTRDRPIEGGTEKVGIFLMQWCWKPD